MNADPISTEAMEVAVSIEKNIPSRITGENRVFIRAVIARAITAAVAAEREACAGVADRMSVEPDADEMDPYDDYEMGGRSAGRHIASAIRARSTP